jgi:hydrogenase expression/formation protein
MDVEEYVRKKIAAGERETTVKKHLVEHILSFKNTSESYASAFATAVMEEVKNSRGLSGDFFAFEPAGVKMGEFGVGSRGRGDFFAHRQIARIIEKRQHLSGLTRWMMPVLSVPAGNLSSVPLTACTPGFQIFRSLQDST